MSPRTLTPRMIALLIGSLFAVIFLISIPFLSSVFKGDLIVNQNLYTIRLDYINVFGITIPLSDIAIRWYSVWVFLGFVCGYALSLFLVRRSPIPETLIDRIAIGLVLFAFLGARIFFVLFHWEYYSQNLGSIFLLYEGGLSVMGGILGGGLYLWRFASRHKFRFLELTDILVPGLLLGQVIGRLGNFFNYEAYGAATNVPWKMFVPESAINANKYLDTDLFSRYFHPTFLYEMIPNIILLVILLSYYTLLTRRNAGLVTAVYLMGYGTIRFFTEFFRLDALRLQLPFSISLPDWLAAAIGGLFPGTIREPFVYWVQNTSWNSVLISQIMAILFVVVGILLWKRRSIIVYSARTQEDLS